MPDFKMLSADEIIAMCKNFMAEKPPADPDHEGWKSELTLTPRMVEQILLANTEE
jgi:hypothetical protein